MSQISLRIADLRKKSRVTQQELADRIGVSFQRKQLRKIFGITNWNISCGHGEIIGMMIMSVFLFRRSGKLINRFLFSTVAVDMAF